MSAQIISFHCVLRDLTGRVLSSSVSREVLTALPGESIPLKGLSRGLQSLKKGEKRRIKLSAQDAYGFYDPAKIILIPRKMIDGGNHLRPGQSVTIVSKSGVRRTYKVLQLFKNTAQLDGNHPLAGQDLDFEIEALDVREATPNEIEEALNPMATQVLH